MTHRVYEYRAVTWRDKYLRELSLDECMLVQLRKFEWSGNARYLYERKEYPVFQQKTINIRIAVNNILRHRLVRECKAGTFLHLLQFAQDIFETSERGMSLDIENE